MAYLKKISTYPLGKLEGSSVQKAISIFLRKADGLYHNPHAVELAWIDDNTIYAAADWPGEKQKQNERIEVGIETDYTSFATLFGITGKVKNAIDNIRPEMLVKLYQDGKAEITCFSEDKNHAGFLEFRKEKDKVLAKDEHNNEHEVTSLLETPQQFKSYTKK